MLTLLSVLCNCTIISNADGYISVNVLSYLTSSLWTNV